MKQVLKFNRKDKAITDYGKYDTEDQKCIRIAKYTVQKLRKLLRHKKINYKQVISSIAVNAGPSSQR